MAGNIDERRLRGVVVSSNSQKTCAVSIERRVKHKLYGKYIRRTSKVQVHDENNIARNGDEVLIKESRPYSKTKSWVLVEVINQNQV